ncbi:bifunctional phosphopantothenoylcysteine decarboxylase/phosphopantothenate--cysteine ligase CoaBC [Staphylothermus hellenicus]|uniref:bifunctional phosphopantothenoylcysteine decarboxylase/phosphopantothenate--cysteine ligase CoaBC n=1 Tax=Staphylothermus hellenicus TaxID=84599 RepID=UPI001FE022F9|nr:bifunctional phosphopantothenoylcysteine decarboxylase/phosphopantothenate--cysteine ligase CoaBC [Staphylothermus hellenicus]
MRILSELPRREEYSPLKNRRLLIGLTASSSIYRSIDLIRKLIRMGAKIKVVMTRESLSLITPDLVEWATGPKPLIEFTGRAEHIELTNWAEAFIIVPATLNTIAKIAYGIGDQLLHLTAITMMGAGKKLAILPTMNMKLYNSPQYREALNKLASYSNVSIINPLIDEGKAKFPPLDDVAHCIDALVNRGRDLEGKHILVTAGPTIEYIDPVRIITNNSSGLMGVLLAREAVCRGATVDLVHGPLRIDPPYNVNKYPVTTTAQMAKTISKLTNEKQYDAAIFAAAPADYTVLSRSRKKISTRELGSLVIRLKQTPKTVKFVSRNNRPKLMIIFSAETIDNHLELVEKARNKLVDYNADLAIANNVSISGIGFSSSYIDACIVSRDSYECMGVIRKEVLMRKIIDLIKQNI